MALVVLIPGPLREHTGGVDRVRLDGSFATVGEALAALWGVHPGLRDRIVDERGAVRPHVNVFLGDEAIRWTGGLATPVTEGAELSIVPAVSGGAPERRRPTSPRHAASPWDLA